MATKAQLQAQVTTLKGQLETCQNTVDARDATIASLKQQLADCKAAQQPAPTPVATPPRAIATPGDLQNWAPADQDRYLDLMKQAGATWIRIGLNWGYPAPGIALVGKARARGLKVLGVLIRPNRSGILTPMEMAAFADQMAQYGDAFEVWNEQNLDSFWPTPDPAKYAAVYNAALGAITNKRPGVTVVSGGLSPSGGEGADIEPVEFLNSAMAAGMKPMAIGWHPYCNPNLPGQDDWWSTWTKMRQHPTSAKYPVWITEFGHPTNQNGGNNVPGETFQAQSVTKAFEVVKGYGWKAPIFIYEGRDGGTAATNNQHHYGLLRYDWSRKPAYDALRAIT